MLPPPLSLLIFFKPSQDYLYSNGLAQRSGQKYQVADGGVPEHTYWQALRRLRLC